MVNHQRHSYAIIKVYLVNISHFSVDFILQCFPSYSHSGRHVSSLYLIFICLQCGQRPHAKQVVHVSSILIFYYSVFRFPFSSFVRLIYVYLAGLLHNHPLSMISLGIFFFFLWCVWHCCCCHRYPPLASLYCGC